MVEDLSHGVPEYHNIVRQNDYRSLSAERLIKYYTDVKLTKQIIMLRLFEKKNSFRYL